MKSRLILLLICYLIGSGFAFAGETQVNCFEQQTPFGDSPGTNRYLTFRTEANGKRTLTFDPSCIYGAKKKCVYPQTRWENLECVETVSTSGKTFSWMCSIPGAENCFFARLWTDNSVNGTPAGTFEFDSFRDCWLTASGGKPFNFHSGGVIFSCKTE